MRDGASVALVSDAGTPAISDPGFKLVRDAARAQGSAVFPIPGPSAVLAALVASGLPTDRFLFQGFLPPRSAARRRVLEELAAVPATLVLFESPQRLAEMLADAAAVLGPRPAVVARELTKLYEEHRRGSLPELAAAYAATRPAQGRGRGGDRARPPPTPASSTTPTVDHAAAGGPALGRSRASPQRRSPPPPAAAPTSSTAAR